MNGVLNLMENKRIFIESPYNFAFGGNSREDAQNAPSPFTIFSLFYDGRFVSHEILSEKKFDKNIAGKGL